MMSDSDNSNPEGAQIQEPAEPSRVKRYAKMACYCLLFLFLLAVIGFPGGAILIGGLFLLCAGWIHFLMRVGPELEWNLAMIGSAFIVLAAAIVGLHFILRHFRKNWRLGATFACTGLIGVLFAAAIAVTGIIHQGVWLAKGDIMVSSRRGIGLAMNISNVRQLILGLRTFEADNGALPAFIYELYPDYIDVDPETDRGKRFWCFEAEDRSYHEWLYFPEARSLPADWRPAIHTTDTDPRICLASPFSFDGKSIAGFVSGSVREMKTEDLLELISAQQEEWMRTPSPATDPASSSPP